MALAYQADRDGPRRITEGVISAVYPQLGNSWEARKRYEKMIWTHQELHRFASRRRTHLKITFKF